MGIYTESLIEKEQQNKHMERLADLSLAKNIRTSGAMDHVEDVKHAVAHIVECFGCTPEQAFGCHTTGEVLDCMLDPLCIMYEEIDLSDPRWKKEASYILAFETDGSAVVLKPKILGYGYYSPSKDTQGMLSHKLKLDSKAYILYRPLNSDGHPAKAFLQLIFRLLGFKDWVTLLVASAVIALLGTGIPAINRWVLNDLLPKGEESYPVLLVAFIAYLAVGIFRGCMQILKTMTLNGMKLRVGAQVQTAVMAKVLFLPQSFFRETSTGKISKRINNSKKTSDNVLDMVFSMSLTVIFSLIYIPQMASYAPSLYRPALLILLIQLVLSFIAVLVALQNETAGMEAEMESSNFLFSLIKGIQKVKGTGSERRVYFRWAEYYRKVLLYRLIPPGFAKWKATALSFVSSFGTILLLAIAVPSGVSRADYISFNASYALILTAITGLTDMMHSIFLLKPLMEQVSVLIEAETEGSKKQEFIRKLNGNIDLEHLYFSYPESERQCLKDISLKIRKGEKIAIVGESGCGKSTLLKIIMGIEKPTSGSVYFDGKPLETLNLRSLRKNIGSVFQFSKLMPGSIYSNIAFTSGSVTMEEAWDAAEKAGIAADIRNLPLGMETEISQSYAGGFSGGQKQRILIARTFASKSPILIFDEATSALDNITQKQVLDQVYQTKSTVIMVAHRLSTVTGCDRILMLENGKIVEQGNYEFLMQQNGKFADLVRKQLVEMNTEE